MNIEEVRSYKEGYGKGYNDAVRECDRRVDVLKKENERLRKTIKSLRERRNCGKRVAEVVRVTDADEPSIGHSECSACGERVSSHDRYCKRCGCVLKGSRAS